MNNIKDQMDQTTTSITLNDIGGSLSEVYVKLTDMSMQMDATNMAMAGMQKEVVQLIDQGILNNGVNLPIVNNSSANIPSINISQSQALSPVYFSNTTNIYWNTAQNEDNKLDIIDGHIQDIITIMNNCGCGEMSNIGGQSGISPANDNDEITKNALDDIQKNRTEVWDVINKSGTALISDNPEKAALDVGKNITEFGLKKVEESFDYKDRYAVTTDNDRAKMDKTQALENIIDFNTTMGQLQAHDSKKSFIDGHRVFDIPLFDRDAGTQEISLAALIKAHPEVLKDQKYIDQVRMFLDRTGDSDLIQSAKNIGFTTEKEKAETQALMNELRIQHKATQSFYDQHLSKALSSQIENSLQLLQISPTNKAATQQQFYNPELHYITSPDFDTTLKPNTTNQWRDINRGTSKIPYQSTTQIGKKGDGTVINIKIDGLIKQFNINTTNLQESSSQISNAVTNALLKAVKDSKMIASA